MISHLEGKKETGSDRKSAFKSYPLITQAAHGRSRRAGETKKCGQSTPEIKPDGTTMSDLFR